jgi:hypothetical protein
MADPAGEIYVQGLTALQGAFSSFGREASAELKTELRTVAEPVRRDAETLAREKIRNIGPTWSQMRVGVAIDSVYVAPKQRGVRRGRDPRKRPNLFGLLLGDALEPALNQNEGTIIAGVEAMLDRLATTYGF